MTDQSKFQLSLLAAIVTIIAGVLLLIGEVAIQSAMDAYAKFWGYDNVVSAITYLNSTNSQWKAEAQALNAWRDSVWLWANAQLVAITANPSLMPTDIQAFVAGIPKAPVRPQVNS